MPDAQEAVRRLAVVGAGPRGVMLLERLLARGFAWEADGTPAPAPGLPVYDLPWTAFVVHKQNHDQTGNRAAGDRIHHGISPGAHAAAIALILCAVVVVKLKRERWFWVPGCSTFSAPIRLPMRPMVSQS